MGDLSNYGKGLAKAWFAGEGPFFLALYTSPPTDAGGGVEVSGGGYARQEVELDPVSAVNIDLVRFDCLGADWGTITHGGYFDAATAGNFIAWAALGAPKTIPSGDALEFQPGTITTVTD